MQIFIRLAQPALCALLLMGAAHSAAAKEPPDPQKDPSRISGFTSWHDGSTGGAYGIGEGWSLVIFPPTYENVTEDVAVRYPPEITVTPATFEWVKEDSEFLKTYPKTATKIVAIPATFETLTEAIEVQPAKTEYYLVEPVYNSDGTLEMPGAIKVRHVPALIKDVRRSVIKTSGRTEERVVPNAPLVRRNGYVRIIKTPEKTTVREVPDIINTVTRRRMKNRERFLVRRPNGKIAHMFDNFEDLTGFTDSLNQPIGALSGKTFKIVKVNDYALPKEPPHIWVRFQNGEIHLVGTCNHTYGNYELTEDLFTLSAMGNMGQHACTELFEMPDGRINERIAKTPDVITEDEFIALGDKSLKIQSNQNEVYFTDQSGNTLIILEH